MGRRAFMNLGEKVRQAGVVGAGGAGFPTHVKLGANADICPVFWYLRYMFEDEKKSDERYVKCKSGGLLCHECKHDLIGPAKDYMIRFKRKREEAKNMVDKFMFED